MTIRRVIGLVLVVAGIVVALWGGFFWTDRDTLIDAGPVQVTRQEHKGVPLPPVVGIIAAIAGTILLVLPDRRRV
jgi:drug/metabolite transporter (DMT)-like permease